MHEDFEEKPAVPKRSVEEDDFEEVTYSRPLQQSRETLKANYNWIGHFRSQHPNYEFLRNQSIPWTDLRSSISDARVALVTAAGVYAKGQRPFSISPEELAPDLLRLKFREKGDPSFRLIPSSQDVEQLLVAYPYLDLSGAEEDINVLFPAQRLLELEEESFIGSVGAHHVSFMGYLPNPHDLEPFLEDAADQLKQDHVDLVILTPGEVLSHQSMVAIQRTIEAAGMVTVSIALCSDVVRHAGTPRSVHYPFPFGFTLGDVNDEATQLRILKDTIRAVEAIEVPGTILELPYAWFEE